MVGRLLERYALTMQEVDLRAEPCIQREVVLPGRQRRPIDGCVPAIARFCSCRVWLAADEGRPRYVFFGFEPDVVLATYLFAVIKRAMAEEVRAFRARSPHLGGHELRAACTSFARGMAGRLDERLEAMHQAREEKVAAQRPTGTALMVVKTSVVEEAFRASKIRLVSARSATVREDGAYRQGYAAGERINLGRPLASSRDELLGS
jgi:uncharacterized DUF497 family protein